MKGKDKISQRTLDHVIPKTGKELINHLHKPLFYIQRDFKLIMWLKLKVTQNWNHYFQHLRHLNKLTLAVKDEQALDNEKNEGFRQAVV